MICKECGAYNPDHATYCKVCAANLKGTPAPEAPEVHEEEQPTKRFSRPSWVVPEQTEKKAAVEETVKAVKETVQPVEEAVADAVEEENTIASAAEEPVEEAAEEETEKVWMPSRVRRSQYQEDLEEEPVRSDEPAETYTEENEGIYNDEEALEDEEDSFEYEPTPPKRKQQKKKNNTMFTVLLIAIIVVIIGVLVAGGLLIAKKMGCFDKNKTVGKDGAGTSETSQQNGDNDQQPGTAVTTPDPQSSETPEVDEKNAVLQKYIDNDIDMVAITVKIPANATVTIDFPHQADYEFVNNDSQELTRKVKIPIAVFYPNEPLTESTREFHPDITIKTSDGNSYKVNCPSFTYDFPKLNISVGSPLPDENGTIMAPEGNVVKISGTVSDPGAEVTINDIVVQVYQGGFFEHEYRFKDDATEDDVDTIKITATKNNFVTDVKELSIHAYKYIPEPMKLEVRSDGAALRVDNAGKLTVNGTTLPGATLTAVSDNTTNVLCGSVTVDGEGNFSFQITTDPSFYGMSVISLDAKKEGADDGSTKFTVIKGFKDKESFLKHYNKTKSYLEISPKKLSIADLLANETQYATNNYGFRITASVVEVINKDGDIIVRMTNNKTNETVYVHNLSEKWAPADNVGGKYNVYCNFIGTYEDTGCAEFLGWFAKKP
jgi:hypothetical protein